jgi:mannose-6-phosphate isomerase
MDWYPLRLDALAKPLVFGGHAIARRLARSGIPDWGICRDLGVQ